jgi:hypothetical protein
MSTVSAPRPSLALRAFGLRKLHWSFRHGLTGKKPITRVTVVEL